MIDKSAAAEALDGLHMTAEEMAAIDALPLLRARIEGLVALKHLIAQRLVDSLPRAYELLPEGAAPVHALTPYLAHIERMAYQGMSRRRIAQRLGIADFVFADCVNRFADVAAALQGGVARAEDELTAGLMHKAAAEHDVSATKFVLQTRHGHVVPREPSGPAVAVQVNVAAQPAPVTLDHAASLARGQAALLFGPEDDGGPVVDGEAVEMQDD